LEFENFKRKYLLVNKHITKLNSTLSVRVEELNGQVANLAAENVRLRASEISLAAQLKKEKKRNNHIVQQAEHVVGSLTHHLVNMRASLGLLTPDATPIGSISPLKNRLPTSPVQPPREPVRLARPPADVITQIRESEEDESGEEASPTRAYSAASRLPLSGFTPRTSQLEIPPEFDLNSASKRKLGRRHSSLLVIDHGAITPITPTEQVPSPVIAPLRRSPRKSFEATTKSLSDEEAEVERTIQSDLDMERAGAKADVSKVPVEKQTAIQDLAESKDKTIRAACIARDRNENQTGSERECSENSAKERRRFGIKDVTNSPRRSPSGFSQEKPASACAHPLTMDTADPPVSSLLLEGKTSATAEAAASTSAISAMSETIESLAGRERRNRRSINYAEPKLNTKMRKPDPSPEAAKRQSSGGTTRRRKSVPVNADEDGDADVETGTVNSRLTENRRKTMYSVTSSRIPMSVPRPSSNMEVSGAWGDEARRHMAA